ncbi:MAG: dihydroneopterin aldolase [Dehalococcoidia bacterium]|nr:dihydroneopterin aldolase [Dehalococcoidia bacterium]
MAQDRVFLEGMVFYGYHGVNAAEKELGQRFIVDLEVTADLTRAGETDDLNDTINYSRLYKLTREVVEGPSCDLIERVAHLIIDRVFAATDAQTARVRIRKPGVAIGGSILAASGVELCRTRPTNGLS